MGQLMLRYSNGDMQAFRSLYRRMASSVRRVLGRYLFTADAVDDAAQKVFARAHRARRRFQPERATPRGVVAWYSGIAKFVAFDELRARRRRNLHLERAEHWGLSGLAESELLSSSPEELVGSERASQVRGRRLRLAMQDISPAQRDLLERLYLREMDFREVSRELGVPAGTLRVRAHRGRANLRRNLGDSVGSPPSRG